jgi:Holliday junction resolvase RusA-like endonuclease
MTELNLFFPMRPLSVNSYYYNLPRGGRGISAEGKQHTALMKIKMHPQRKEIKEFIKLNFSSYIVKYYNFVPRSTYFTLKGEINIKGQDVDNINKVQIDTIFRYMGVNDTKIIDLIVMKRPTDKEAHFTFKIIGLSKEETLWQLENI